MEKNILLLNTSCRNIPFFTDDDLDWLSLKDKEIKIVMYISDLKGNEMVKKYIKFYNFVGGPREWKEYKKVLCDNRSIIVENTYLINL